jgi:uncharacterized membrane protein
MKKDLSAVLIENRQPKRRLKIALNTIVHEGTIRVEGFSDGVFAIAATLLAVEMKVPRGASNIEQLQQTLTSQWPVYISYGMSFVYLGIYWSHHTRVFRLFKRTDHIFLKLNVLFLMMIALIPFPTALLGEFLQVRDERGRLVVLIYSGLLFATSCFFNLIWLYATYRNRLIDQNTPADLIKTISKHYGVAPIVYGLAFLVAFWSPPVSLFLNFLAALFYFLPFQLVHHHH